MTKRRLGVLVEIVRDLGEGDGDEDQPEYYIAGSMLKDLSPLAHEEIPGIMH
jgi:hypothetical protein